MFFSKHDIVGRLFKKTQAIIHSDKYTFPHTNQIELLPVHTIWCISRNWWHTPRKPHIYCPLPDPLHTYYTWNWRKLIFLSCSGILIFTWYNDKQNEQKTKQKQKYAVESTAEEMSKRIIRRYYRIDEGGEEGFTTDGDNSAREESMTGLFRCPKTKTRAPFDRSQHDRKWTEFSRRFTKELG